MFAKCDRLVLSKTVGCSDWRFDRLRGRSSLELSEDYQSDSLIYVSSLRVVGESIVVNDMLRVVSLLLSITCSNLVYQLSSVMRCQCCINAINQPDNRNSNDTLHQGYVWDNLTYLTTLQHSRSTQTNNNFTTYTD